MRSALPGAEALCRLLLSLTLAQADARGPRTSQSGSASGPAPPGTAARARTDARHARASGWFPSRGPGTEEPRLPSALPPSLAGATAWPAGRGACSSRCGACAGRGRIGATAAWPLVRATAAGSGEPALAPARGACSAAPGAARRAGPRSPAARNGLQRRCEDAGSAERGHAGARAGSCPPCWWIAEMPCHLSQPRGKSCEARRGSPSWWRHRRGARSARQCACRRSG